MKRAALIIPFLAVFSLTCQAQTSLFGPKVGANVSSWYNTFQANVNWIFGFQAGVAWDNNFGNKFHFAPEILFIQKGYVVRTPQTERVDKLRLNYLEVPLIGKFDLDDKKKNHPFLSLGATVSYFLSGSYEQSQVGLDPNSGQLDNPPDRKFDFGGLAGFGMDLGRFIFEARGQVGFAAPYDFDTARNATISINFTYLFGSKEEVEEDEFEIIEEVY